MEILMKSHFFLCTNWEQWDLPKFEAFVKDYIIFKVDGGGLIETSMK